MSFFEKLLARVFICCASERRSGGPGELELKAELYISQKKWVCALILG